MPDPASDGDEPDASRPEGLPWLHWILADESEMDPRALHNLILPEIDLAVGELMHLTIGHPARPRLLGIAEVVAVKRVRIGDIEPLDLRRSKTGCRTPREILAAFHGMDPSSDATLSSLCSVVTIRRNAYDLGALGAFVARDEAYRSEGRPPAGGTRRPRLRLTRRPPGGP